MLKQTWYLTPPSISYLAQFILSTAIAGYLSMLAIKFIQQKAENRHTTLLAAFFILLGIFTFAAQLMRTHVLSRPI